MRTTPLFVSPITRLTLFFGALALLACGLSFILAPTAASCGGPPPMPLRPLYIISERIVVARAGQSALLPTETTENYQQTPVRTSFYVSQTLKGKEEEVVHVYQMLYGDNRSVPKTFAEGTTLLLFLSPQEGGEGYELAASDSFAVKKLSEDDLKVYVERIEELAVILRDKEPDKNKIVDWLVRCAEEKATRWEGAFELNTSQYALINEQEKSDEKEEENVADAADEAAVDTPSEPSADAAPEEVQPMSEELVVEREIIRLPPTYSLYNSEMARLLTPDHKKRLANTLFKLEDFTEPGDSDLLQLVLSLKADDRIIPFIISHLNKVSQEPPPYVEHMVTALAGALDDDALIARAEKYSEYAMYYDPTEEEERAESDVAEEGDNEEVDAEEEPVDQEELALQGNSAQKRSARLKKFLAEAERIANSSVRVEQ